MSMVEAPLPDAGARAANAECCAASPDMCVYSCLDIQEGGPWASPSTAGARTRGNALACGVVAVATVAEAGCAA